jgi:hypothetical protein
VFEDLLAFARKSHRVPDAAAQLSRDGYHRLPTGLVLAGGVNSADHAQTFPSLVEHLRAQVGRQGGLHWRGREGGTGEAGRAALERQGGRHWRGRGSSQRLRQVGAV